MLSFMINECLKLEITQIAVVQNVFQPIEFYLETISHISSSRFFHMYILPLLLAFSVKLYVNVMIAAISSHITINLLKWILAEDRPFWWVQETSAYTVFERPEIRQTYLTCETTPGNPSGHVMFSASVLFVAMQEILPSMQWYRSANSAIKYCTWNIYIGLLALVTISRLYFACHFLHQCLLGAGLGVGLSHLLRQYAINERIARINVAQAFVIGIALSLLTISTYFGQLFITGDTLWSVKKAFNWCKDPYFIKPETTSIYSLVREFGLLFGLIMASPNVKRYHIRFEWKLSLPATVAIIGVNYFLTDIIPRWSGPLIFYCFTFLVNMVFVLLLMLIVPLIGRKKQEEHSD